MIGFYRLALIGLLILSGLFAQQRGMSIDDRLKHLTEILDLSDQQQKDIRVIMTDLENKMKAIRDEYGDDREPMREHMQPLRREMNDRILEVLTPEQQKEFKAFLDERRQKRQERMGRNQ